MKGMFTKFYDTLDELKQENYNSVTMIESFT